MPIISNVMYYLIIPTNKSQFKANFCSLVYPTPSEIGIAEFLLVNIHTILHK